MKNIVPLYVNIYYRAQMRKQKLFKQGYVAPMLKSSLQKLYGLFDRYEISISQMAMDLLLFTQMVSFLYHCQHIYQTLLYIWVGVL